MGSSAATPPQPPGLSAEEKDLLAKQGITLDQFSNLLSQSTVDSGQTQDLLRQLSGLYAKKPAVAANETIDTGKIQSEITKMQQDAIAAGQLGGVKPNDPKYQQLQAALNDVNVARNLGFTKGGPGSPDSWQLDPQAVQDLRARIVAEDAAQKKIGDLSTQRYTDALEGKTPLSSGLLQQKETDFKLLREGAARRGIVIEGDTPETATSNSTAGNELVGQFHRTYGLLEDTEKRAVIDGGAPNVQPGYATPLNFATSSATAGPTGLLPTYSNLSSQYAGAGTPYAQQRLLGYQGQVAGYNAGRQQTGAMTGLLGTGAGIAAMAGGPAGYSTAAGLGLLGLGASYL